MALKSLNPKVAIVGINREASNLLLMLLDSGNVNVLRILNPDREDLAELEHWEDLDVVIDTSNDPEVSERLRGLKLPNIDIIGALSARIFFLTGGQTLEGQYANDRGRVFSSLHEIRQAILLSKNKEELLKLILNIAIRTCSADSGSIMLLDTEKRFLNIEIADGLSREIVTTTTQKVSKGIAGKVVRTGEPLLLTGPVAAKHQDGDRREIVSSICAPLIIGEEPMGVLSVNSATPGKEFTQDDLDYVLRLTNFTADIVRTSKEYEESNLSTFSLSLLQSVRMILDLDYPFDERLNLLLLRVVNTFGGEICNFYYYNHDSQSFFLKASSSFKLDLLKGKKLKLSEYLAKQILKSNETVVLDVYDNETSQRKWYIAHPVKIRGSMAGLLFLHLVSDRKDFTAESKVLGKIGDMVTVEMSKDLAIESSRIMSEKFSAISEASFDLANAGSKEELAQVIVTVACLVLEAESCVLRIIDKKSGKLKIFDSFSLRSSHDYRGIQVLDGTLAEEVFQSSRVLIENDLQNSAKYADPDISAHSAMSMCLNHKGTRVGTLSIYDKTSLDLFGSSSFNERDKDVFVNLCLQASKAFVRFLPELQRGPRGL